MKIIIVAILAFASFVNAKQPYESYLIQSHLEASLNCAKHAMNSKYPREEPLWVMDPLKSDHLALPENAK